MLIWLNCQQALELKIAYSWDLKYKIVHLDSDRLSIEGQHVKLTENINIFKSHEIGFDYEN